MFIYINMHFAISNDPRLVRITRNQGVRPFLLNCDYTGKTQIFFIMVEANLSAAVSAQTFQIQ